MKPYKAAFFDMDGVLVDSMKYHCQTWIEAFKQHNIAFDPKMAYRNEGRTGASTINLTYQNQKGTQANKTDIEDIYNYKTSLFRNLPPAPAIDGMYNFVSLLKNEGVDLWVVTGSAQQSLISRLEHHYPECFYAEKMVTGKDVIHGKPHPEPYLKALEKSGYEAHEVFVVENAPLGVKSAVAANINTLAINTGILDNEELACENPSEVFMHSDELIDWWKANCTK